MMNEKVAANTRLSCCLPARAVLGAAQAIVERTLHVRVPMRDNVHLDTNIFQPGLPGKLPRHPHPYSLRQRRGPAARL